MQQDKQRTRKNRAGDQLSPQTVRTIRGRQVGLFAPDGLTHIQFRRFAGCPACSLHLRSIASRHGEITAAGIREVVFFHSSDDELLKFFADSPLDVVADPTKRFYKQFGIEPSPWALLHPRACRPMAVGIAIEAWDAISQGKPIMKLSQEHGFLGVPADLLVGPDGTVLAAKYGTYNFDQWSVDELLDIASRAASPAPAEAPAVA